MHDTTRHLAALGARNQQSLSVSVALVFGIFLPSTALSADASSALHTISDPNIRPQTYESGSRNGNTVFFLDTSQRPFVTTIGGVTRQVVLPTDVSRINHAVTGLSGDGNSVIGWSDHVMGSSSTNQLRLFRYTLTGPLVEYAPANATSVAVAASDSTGSAISGSYTTIVNGVLVRQAFLWRPDSAAFTMISGLEGSGSVANATGISSDGTTVIGNGFVSNVGRGFRYTSGTGTVLLGMLGDSNRATIVSRDGSVIGGQYKERSPQGAPNADTERAFRWTAAGGMQDIGTLGATFGLTQETVTTLNALNESGSVLVGKSAISNASATMHAFRWTSANGGTMEDLGTTASGLSSSATDVSEDGNVIVGSLTDTGNGAANGGFYWTRDAGMRTVDDALRAEGVSLAADVTLDARRVSGDGTVISGLTKPTSAGVNDIYFARIARATSGIITREQLQQSLESSYQPQLDYETSQINLIFNGVGGLPMRNLMGAGQQAYWNTFDLGYTDGSGAQGGFGLGEFGFAAGLDGGTTARLALNAAYADLNLDNDGHLTTRSLYIAPDLTLPLSDSIYLTMGAALGSGQADITRGYANGSSLDFSAGSAETASYGGKIRLDWLDAVALGETRFTPYAALNYSHLTRDAYEEKGGAFPARFAQYDNDVTVAR